MTSDWIKMRTDLYRDPKVCLMADMLLDPTGDLATHVSQNCQCAMVVTRNVMRHVTVGALVTVWGVMRHRGKRDGDDLIVARINLAVIDDVADLPGFGVALESVGWAVETDTGVILPRFFQEYNVQPSEEAKSKAAERSKRYREKIKADRHGARHAHVTSQNHAREEETREEDKKISLSLVRETVEVKPEWAQDLWERWMNVWFASQGRWMPALQQETILMDLSRRGPEKGLRDLEFTIRKGGKNLLDSDHDLDKRLPASGRTHSGKRQVLNLGH